MNIFIDLDGTIVDSSDRHYQVYKKIVEKMGGVPMPKDEYWELIRDKANKDVILEKSNLASIGQSAYLAQFINEIETEENLGFEKFISPNALSVLEKLNKNHKITLITLRKNREGALNQIKLLEIDKYVDEVVICSADKASEIKPRLTKNLKDNIMVGDTEADIDAAKALGIKSVGLLSGFRNRRLMEQFKPDYICANIEELNEIIPYEN